MDTDPLVVRDSGNNGQLHVVGRVTERTDWLTIEAFADYHHVDATSRRRSGEAGCYELWQSGVIAVGNVWITWGRTKSPSGPPRRCETIGRYAAASIAVKKK